METINSLESTTLEELQELIEINVDSAKGLRMVADVAKDEVLAEVFRRMARYREGHAVDLQRYVGFHHRASEGEDSLADAIHRIWIDLRSAVEMGDLDTLLSQADRGEGAITRKYKELIERTTGSVVHDVLQAQYTAIRQQRDSIRSLQRVR